MIILLLYKDNRYIIIMSRIIKMQAIKKAIKKDNKKDLTIVRSFKCGVLEFYSIV